MPDAGRLPIFRTRARTFWFASRFLPPAERGAVKRLYSFARAVDDLADEPSRSRSPEQTAAVLSAWYAWLENPASATAAPDALIASEIRPVLLDRGVPARYLQLLVEGVASDVYPRRIACWPELREYCIQVASSVGLAVCHLLGVGDDALACEAAIELGIAMQLTNILRDIGEDMDAARVYLPADELAAHGSSTEHLQWLRERVISHGPSAIDRPFRRLMAAQVERARAHYARGRDGIPRLPPDAQLAIALAGRLYEAVLDVIEDADYDVFSQRAATSTWAKLGYAAQCWVRLRLRGRFRLMPLEPEGAHS